MTETIKCDTCGTEVASRDELLVYALPGIPVSVANCVRCWREDLYPAWAIIGETASIGGLEHAAAWWKDAVARSLPVVGLTEEEFSTQVDHVIVEFLESRF
jgi:hypothetical protein